MRKRTPRTMRDPMDWINRRMPLADDQQRDIGIAYRCALQALLGEHGTEQAWSTVACAMNTALLLAEQGVHTEAEPIIKLAQDALIHVRNHALTSGEWRINLAHHHKQAILMAVNAHDEQCASCTKGQVRLALLEVRLRVEMGEVMA